MKENASLEGLVNFAKKQLKGRNVLIVTNDQKARDRTIDFLRYKAQIPQERVLTATDYNEACDRLFSIKGHTCVLLGEDFQLEEVLKDHIRLTRLDASVDRLKQYLDKYLPSSVEQEEERIGLKLEQEVEMALSSLRILIYDPGLPVAHLGEEVYIVGEKAKVGYTFKSNEGEIKPSVLYIENGETIAKTLRGWLRRQKNRVHISETETNFLKELGNYDLIFVGEKSNEALEELIIKINTTLQERKLNIPVIALPYLLPDQKIGDQTLAREYARKPFHDYDIRGIFKKLTQEGAFKLPFIIQIGGAISSGKTTFSRVLEERLSETGIPSRRYIKITTREPREGFEVEGVDMIHKPREEYEKEKASGGIILPYEHDGNKYGYPRDFLTSLEKGKNVITEGDLRLLIAIRDNLLTYGSHNRIVSFRLFADEEDTIERVARRQGIRKEEVPELRDEIEYYLGRGEYRHTFYNPTTENMSQEQFIKHLADRAIQILKREETFYKRQDVNPEQLREIYIRELVKSWLGIGVEDILEKGAMSRIEDEKIKRYASKCGKGLKELRNRVQRKVIAERGYGILYVGIIQTREELEKREEKCLLLDLLEMQLGLPQYRYEEFNPNPVSPMGLISTDAFSDFCLSYSLYDPPTLPIKESPLHTLVIGGVFNGKKVPKAKILEQDKAYDQWKQRKYFIVRTALPYTSKPN